MSCCLTSRPLPPPAPSHSGGLGYAGRSSSESVVFQYVGRTGLTVIGPITGLRYRFEGPGEKLDVDPRDVRWLAGIPSLRRT